jgi:hypothetical protein
LVVFLGFGKTNSIILEFSIEKPNIENQLYSASIANISQTRIFEIAFVGIIGIDQDFYFGSDTGKPANDAKTQTKPEQDRFAIHGYSLQTVQLRPKEL